VLRVGLTGGLGSGKSTVADLLRALGAEVVEADQLGRALMEPGQSVYAEIVRVFGSEVVYADGRLNRTRLAKLAFEGNRVQELNALVHPAAIRAQQQWTEALFARDPAAIAIVESALIFEVERDARLRGETEGVLASWRQRFDRVVVVTAPDGVKIARYLARLSTDPAGREAAQADARNRLALQIPDLEKTARADYVLENSGDRAALEAQVAGLWLRLKADNNKIPQNEF
jgi:dephospho-CoA kinase